MNTNAEAQHGPAVLTRLPPCRVPATLGGTLRIHFGMPLLAQGFGIGQQALNVLHDLFERGIREGFEEIGLHEFGLIGRALRSLRTDDRHREKMRLRS